MATASDRDAPASPMVATLSGNALAFVADRRSDDTVADMRSHRARRGFTLFEVAVCLLLITLVSTTAYFAFGALYDRDDLHRTTQIAQAYERRVRALSQDDAGALANPLRNAHAGSSTTPGDPAYSPLRAAAVGFTPGVSISGISSIDADVSHLDDDGRVTLSQSRSSVCIDFTGGGPVEDVDALSAATISEGACP